jgi:periplasmic divalent cation tolerance protein
MLVLCTAPAGVAEVLARQLVEERACACVNVLPGVRSVFRWQGKVDTADECLLLAKTTRAASANLRERIAALHPYDVPEVLEVAVDGGLPAYLRWLADAVQGP